MRYTNQDRYLPRIILPADFCQDFFFLRKWDNSISILILYLPIGNYFYSFLQERLEKVCDLRNGFSKNLEEYDSAGDQWHLVRIRIRTSD